MRIMFIPIFLILIFSFLIPVLHAQEKLVISGRILTADQQPLQNATISLYDSSSGQIFAFAISKADGRFVLKKENLYKGYYQLVIEHLNANREVRNIYLDSIGPVQSDYLFILQPAVKQLAEISIKAAPLPFSIRGDTVEFKAKAYRNAETRKVEDLLRNIQGFELGSNGRISFNGKEVDRILIEGEDLTEKNYQVLSRNLNANLVDKVQVIHNFSTDRLLQEVEKSGKIGINLVIDEKFKSKLSGSLEVGSGIGKREYLDNNMVLISPKIKLISFLNYNETGMPANANLQYYFNQGDESQTPVSDGMVVSGLLQAGIIYLPKLGQTYIRDNEDLSGFVIGSWKAGKGVKMKALAGAGRSRLQNSASGFNQFLPADGNSWLLFQDEKSRSSMDERILKFSLSHDRQKNNTGSLTVDLLRNISENKYDNLSFGAITDTLKEHLNSQGWLYRIAGNETFRLTKRKVLKINFQLNRENLLQDFEAATNRYQDFFMLDSNYRFFRQQLKGVLTTRELDLSVYGRSKILSWYAGFRGLNETSTFEAESNSSDPGARIVIKLGQPPSEFNSFRISVYGMLSKPVHKKGEISSGASVGLGTVKINQNNNAEKKTSPVIRGILGYRYALSPVKNIFLQYNFSSQLPERLIFHPVSLLSGQATILNPAEQLVNLRNHLLSFTYASHNLLKGTGLVLYVSFNQTDGAYKYSSMLTPSYSYLFYLPQNGNKMWTGNTRVDKYFSPMRTKFSLQFSSVYSANDLVFNEILSRNKMINLSVQPKAVTSFKAPVNLEASVTAMYNRNLTIPESGDGSRFELWQYQGYGKLKIQAGKKMYMAAMYNYYILAPRDFFQTMDLYANFSFSQAWIFSAAVHNLFNASSIVQRQFGVNSVSEQRYELVGRYLMIKVQRSF